MVELQTTYANNSNTTKIVGFRVSEILKLNFRWLPEGSKWNRPAKLASLVVSRRSAASAPLSSPLWQEGFTCCVDSAG